MYVITTALVKCYFPATESIIEPMSQYQKHIRNATFYWINLAAICGSLLLLLLSGAVQAKSEIAPQPVLFYQTTPTQQGDSNVHPLLILPVESTAIILQTHIATFQLNYENDVLNLKVDALYRLKNPDHAPIVVVLKITPSISITQTLLPESVGLLAADQPLALSPAGALGYTTQVQIAGDGTVELHLSYAVNLDQVVLPTIVYPVNLLEQWPVDRQNGISLRIDILPAPAISPDSWLPPAPPEWAYTQPADGALSGIKWLYDARFPDQPILFQIIHPARWQELQAAQQAATPGAPLSNFMHLGDLYRQLYTASPVTSDTMTKERFYAQALAAYTAGLERGDATGVAQDQAALHAGLALLYRQRASDASPASQGEYASLMSQEANLALQGLPAADPQRQALLQWQSEGLKAQLEAARSRRNWGEALGIVDELAKLPPEIGAAMGLTETRHTLTVQQALQFLEQDNHAAAVALAGAEISDPALLPPIAARTLFASWQVTTTMTPEATRLDVVGLPLADRQVQAQAALQGLINLWKSNETSGSVNTFELESSATASGPLHLVITLPATASGAALAHAVPQSSDWALLRVLLAQIEPHIERESQLLRQRISMTQPLDLRTAGDQWAAMAATLEREATQLEAQSAAIDPADAKNAESALRLRIQSANYRTGAQEWHNLMRNSWVAATLTAPIGLQTVSRSWMATTSAPAQQLSLQAEALGVGRFVVVLVVVLFGILLLAGTLWWLL